MFGTHKMKLARSRNENPSKQSNKTITNEWEKRKTIDSRETKQNQIKQIKTTNNSNLPHLVYLFLSIPFTHSLTVATNLFQAAWASLSVRVHKLIFECLFVFKTPIITARQACISSFLILPRTALALALARNRHPHCCSLVKFGRRRAWFSRTD